MRELGKPVIQPLRGGLFQRPQIRRRARAPRDRPTRAIPQPVAAATRVRTAVRSWPGPPPAGTQLPARCSPRSGSAAEPHAPAARTRIRESPDQPHQQPVPMHRRMPVVAAIKRRREFSRRSHVRITVQPVGNLVRIFLVHAGESEIRVPFSSADIKGGSRGGRLCTNLPTYPATREK